MKTGLTWQRIKLLPWGFALVVLLLVGLGLIAWAAASGLLGSLQVAPGLAPYLEVGVVVLGIVVVLVASYKLREWYYDWLLAGLPVGPPPPPVTHFFQRLMLCERGPVRHYLRRTFANQINTTNVFRVAALEMLHNAQDIRCVLDRVDPRDNQPIGERGWFVRIAYRCASDSMERGGSMADTAQGVFLEFVRKRLGIWDRLGLAGDARLPALAIEFHDVLESLSGQHGDLKRILEEDLNTDQLAASERRLGEDHPDRSKAIGLLRHKLGLK